MADKSLVAALLKKYLNDLPEPLFPFSVFPDILAVDAAGLDKAGPRLRVILQFVPPMHEASIKVGRAPAHPEC
jgi:hypothetical protein